LATPNLSTTADVYTHTSADAEREAALAVERAVYGDLFVNVRENANTNKSAAIRFGDCRSFVPVPVFRNKKLATAWRAPSFGDNTQKEQIPQFHIRCVSHLETQDQIAKKLLAFRPPEG
jgi:hypothetical protein